MDTSLLRVMTECAAAISAVLGAIYIWDKFSPENKEKWIGRTKSGAFNILVLSVIALSAASIIGFVLKDGPPSRVEIFTFVLSFFALIIWTYIWADDRRVKSRPKQVELSGQTSR